MPGVRVQVELARRMRDTEESKIPTGEDDKPDKLKPDMTTCSSHSNPSSRASSSTLVEETELFLDLELLDDST